MNRHFFTAFPSQSHDYKGRYHRGRYYRGHDYRGHDSGPLRLLGIASGLVSMVTSLLVTAPLLAQEFEPPDQGLPGRREGGGTRGGCLAQAGAQPHSLTALIPATNTGRTVTAHPSLFWYVPQNTAAAAEFVLLDAANTEIYKTILPISQQPGVLSLSLPADGSVPALEVGKSYRWYFSLICDPLDRSADSFTTGWVQRTEPSTALAQQLSAAAEEEKPLIYASAGIWYEALAGLAELRREQPQNAQVQTQWQTLLESVGLAQIADQPLLSP
jgi:Domain of Unknown Function (DUF928)